MPDLNIPLWIITTTIFVALLLSVFLQPDLVAVVVVTLSVAGLALNWLRRQYSSQQNGGQEERERRGKGDRWW
jgi:hypothetical protein